MGFLDFFNHLFNFFAPAFVVGLLLAVVAPFVFKKKWVGRKQLAQAAINFVVCALVLVVGLWFFGRDAKMATYGAMVLVAALAQAITATRA